MKISKPPRLRPGDTVAVLSPSWGGPATYPHVFDLGLANLRELLGVRVKEYPTTRLDATLLHHDPQARARDLNAAFADPEVKAIIASIGGDDSIRLLPYLDSESVAANPKIVMGFSDTTILLTFAAQLGLVTFNGPSVMAGFAQLKTLPPTSASHIRAMLTEPCDRYEYSAYDERITAFQNWGEPNYAAQITVAPNPGWQWLQGAGRTQGRLFGGCLDVLEFVKGTEWWPAPEFWNGKILFLETSEEKPTPAQIKYILRNYGMQGIFERVNGLLFARPMGYSLEERETLHEAILSVVAGEFGEGDLPIVAEMDFGHEGPQSIIPLNTLAEIDCDRRTFSLQESPVR